MIELDTRYPGYGFSHHKGYGTREHAAALDELGACDAHRMTFAPLVQRRLL
jgi:ribonuclease HII